MMMFEGWFAPVPRSEQTATKTALVILADPHPAVATTLILQEMGYSVDLGAEPAYALRWLQRARYDVVLAGGAGVGVLSFATRIREAAPRSRVLVIPEPGMHPEDTVRLGIETIDAPVDVNQMVALFRED